jgi:hypothetical protein
MKTYWLSALLPFFAGVIGGMALGYFGRNIFSASLKPTIDVVQVCNLIATLLIALILQHFIAGKRSNDRVEKDMLIGQARSVGATARDIREAIRRSMKEKSSHPEPHVFLGQFSLLMEAAEGLKELCSECDPKDGGGPADPILASATGYHRFSTANFPFSPMNLEEFLASEREFALLQKAVTRFTITINRR